MTVPEGDRNLSQISDRKRENKNSTQKGAVLFWLGYRDSDSRGTKPLGRRGSDSMVKGCHSLPLRSNPNFMRENKNSTQKGAVLFCIAPLKKISHENPYGIRDFGVF